MAKKPTKKELKEMELKRKEEIAKHLVGLFKETFEMLEENKSYVPGYIKGEIKQYGYDIEDLKTEDCDFIFKRLLHQCQNIYDSISDQFFCTENGLDKSMGSIDDCYSNGRILINDLIDNYEKYTDKRLYQFVSDTLIENVKLCKSYHKY
jgi:hypothetical protein